MPSVRELSERLNVNPNTVAKAYRDLEVMGLLYTRRGTAFSQQRLQIAATMPQRIIGRLHEVVAEAKARHDRQEVSEVAEKSYQSETAPSATPNS